MLLKSLQTNILLIDDDEDDHYIFKMAMAEVSPLVNIHCLQDSNQLLEVINNLMPSLIFIDFYLPMRSGIFCLQQIKSHPVYKDIPVIMWSSSSYTSNIDASYDSGAHLYMEKPYNKKSLEERLKIALEELVTNEMSLHDSRYLQLS